MTGAVKHREEGIASSPVNGPLGLWSEERVAGGGCVVRGPSGSLSNHCSGQELIMLVAVCLMEWLTMGFWMGTNAGCWEMQGWKALWDSAHDALCFCLPCTYIILCLTSLFFPASVLSITTGNTIIWAELHFCRVPESQWIIWHHRTWWIISDHMPWKIYIP